MVYLLIKEGREEGRKEVKKEERRKEGRTGVSRERERENYF